MTCDDVRPRLLDYQRGHLAPAARVEVRTHLEGCADCARADGLEQELTSVLEQRLPQHPASIALKRRLAARWAAPAPRRSRWSGWRPVLIPALAVMAVTLLVGPVAYYERAVRWSARDQATLVAEVVTDHLRVLSSQHPLDIASGGLHQVKPWFEGRLDFAPVVGFEGDAEFPLRGGALGYVQDRKAAVLVYAHRLHPISLIVVRAEGLPWPTHPRTEIGAVPAFVTSERGFNVIMWRTGELGYVLVSDVDAHELRRLAARIAGPAPDAR